MTEYEAIPLGLHINGVRVLTGTAAFTGVRCGVAFSDRYYAIPRRTLCSACQPVPLTI